MATLLLVACADAQAHALFPMAPSLPSALGSPVPTPPAPTSPVSPGPIAALPEPGMHRLHPPFSADHNRRYNPDYLYGTTLGGELRPHHGMDILNPPGTPVLAAGAGMVVFAEADDEAVPGIMPNFYGNTVILRLNKSVTTQTGEKQVYVLYAHLREIRVTLGERVDGGDVLGTVGSTGVARGPHLHLEVRLGNNRYSHAVNPAFWFAPAAGTGHLAVELTDGAGRPWQGIPLILRPLDAPGRPSARGVTYSLEPGVPADPLGRESGALYDLPPGRYLLSAGVPGGPVSTEVRLRPGEVTWARLRAGR